MHVYSDDAAEGWESMHRRGALREYSFGSSLPLFRIVKLNDDWCNLGLPCAVDNLGLRHEIRESYHHYLCAVVSLSNISLTHIGQVYLVGEVFKEHDGARYAAHSD